MKMIINCPLCNHILVTDYQPFVNKKSACYKFCMNNSHYFKEVSYDNNHDEVRYLIIKLNTAFPIYNAPYWKFNLESKEILINHKKISTFFYPDFSDLNKLKNKLRICIAFS